jgi:uncharacterized protein
MSILFPGLPAAVTVLALSTAAASAAPTLTPVGSYDTELGADGAEIISVRSSDGVAALTNIAGSVDLIDLADPTSPELLRRVPIDPDFGTPNSVAIHPHRDYFLVVSGSSGEVGTVSAYRISDGTLLASASVGTQPDSIAISPSGRIAVVANEAEATDEEEDGGDGSLSTIDLSDFDGFAPATLVATSVPLPTLSGTAGFSTGRTDDIGRLPIDNSPATLEPESVAFAPRNSRFAYVTLQENNGVARLDLRRNQLRFYGLGTTTHAADLSTAGGYVPSSTLTAFREPDGIALPRNGRFFATADEGDTRDESGSGSPRGGRTVSVFLATTGELLGDTGSQIDDAAAAAGLYPDSRSNRGACEPEGLDLIRRDGYLLVAVGLERANAVALVDVTEPTQPTVIDIEPVGSNPEGVKFFLRDRRLFVASANEASGTVSVLEVVF